MGKTFVLIGVVLSFLGCKKEINYLGKYKKPQILEKLEKYQNAGLADWEPLEFWIAYDYYYNVTPLDVISFAATGNNGIHFGFLTDFGNAENLEDAPIVCIAPSYDPQVNLVARDIRQFLSLVASAEQSTLLADIYKNEEEFETRKKESLDWQMDDWSVQNRKKLLNLLKNDFDITPVRNVLSETIKLRKDRESLVNVKTIDGLGLRIKPLEEISEFDYNNDPNRVKKYLESVNLCSRIKFYRDASAMYILSDDYDEEIKYLILEHLNQDGFTREAKILEGL